MDLYTNFGQNLKTLICHLINAICLILTIPAKDQAGGGISRSSDFDQNLCISPLGDQTYTCKILGQSVHGCYGNWRIIVFPSNKQILFENYYKMLHFREVKIVYKEKIDVFVICSLTKSTFFVSNSVETILK